MKDGMTRREFLRTAALAGVGVLAKPEVGGGRDRREESMVEEEKAREEYRRRILEHVREFFGDTYLQEHPYLFSLFVMSGGREVVEDARREAYGKEKFTETVNEAAVLFIQTDVRGKGVTGKMSTDAREPLTDAEIAAWKQRLKEELTFSVVYGPDADQREARWVKYKKAEIPILQALALSQDRKVRGNLVKAVKALLDYNQTAWADWGARGGLPHIYRDKKWYPMYPMDSAGALLNYTRALHAVWRELETPERERYLESIQRGIAAFKNIAGEFEGILPRYIGLRAGEPLSPQSAPDDDTAPPTAMLSYLSTLLRDMGAYALAEETLQFVRALMARTDEIFYHEVSFPVEGQEVRFGQSLGHCDVSKAREAAEKEKRPFTDTARHMAEPNIPADGTRLAEARIGLVEAMLQKTQRGKEETLSCRTHILRAMAELRTYMRIARRIPLFIVSEETGEFVAPDEVRERFFSGRVIGTNAWGKVEDLAIQRGLARYLAPNENEGTHREWPRAFAACFDFFYNQKLRSRLQEVVGKEEYGVLKDAMSAFAEEAREFLVALFEGSRGAYREREKWYNELVVQKGESEATKQARNQHIEPPQPNQMRGLMENFILTTMPAGAKWGSRGEEDGLLPVVGK
ncbi:MAG: hypothetical protein AB1352_04855 [Patescibacteria group bacterium]